MKKWKAARCLFAALALVFLLSAAPGAVPKAAAAPAAAPAGVPHAAPTGGGSIWGQVLCNTVLVPVLGTSTPGVCFLGKILGSAGKSAVSAELQATIVKPMADGLGEFTAQVLKVGLTWWLTTPSVSVENSGVTSQQTGKAPDGSTVTFSLQGVCLGVGEMIAILLVMFAGFKTMIQRKGKPLADAIQGLVINVLVCVLGITIIDSLLVASDSLTTAIINVAFHGDAKLAERMVLMLLPTGFNPMALLVMALIVLLIGVIQFGLLFLRQASIPIQALLLPIAGSGQIGGERTRQWLPKLYTSIFTVIAYKPMAALIISAGFVELANGNALVDWLRGIVTLALSVIALKSLMGLFAPLGVSVAGATAGGFAGALTGAGALAELGGRFGGRGDGGGSQGTNAVKHAQDMAKQSGGHPALAAAQVGTGAVRQARTTAANTMGGGDGGQALITRPDSDGKTGTVPKQGGGQDGKPGGGDGGHGSGGVRPSGPGGAPTSGGGGVSVSLRAAEAGARGVRAAGNTVSEGNNE